MLSTLVQLLHYILKCNYFGMTTVSFFVNIIGIPDEELFSETSVGCTASYICLDYIMFPLVVYAPQCIAIIAVAVGWMLLDIG